MSDILNFIDGAFVPPIGGQRLDNVEPATGRVYGTVPDSDAQDVEAAVRAAERAFPAWSRLSAEARAQFLLALADRIDASLEDLARAESIDTGKPLALARSLEIPRASSNLRFFATAAIHFHSESHSTGTKALNYTLRRPRGVAGVISPWNLPLYLLTWKIAPALASGNTVVAKPTELAPMTAALLAQLAKDVGFPKGVLNIVHGRGAAAGAAIVAHPRVPAISFTGGTVTGSAIATAAAPLFKKVALEMGGKNPNIVFADADLDEAVTTSLRAAFTNQGEICLAGSRLYVEESIRDTFVERFVAGARRLVVGDPLEDKTDQGALISSAHRDKVLGYLDAARQEGGRFLCGGGVPESLPERCRNGFFVAPTVVEGLAPMSRVNREEIFGPVVTVTPFKTEEEVLGWANGTDYGLSATLFTSHLGRAHRVAERLASGTVWVNCWLLRDLRVPFGGMKRSGLGREGGEEALRFFTEPKNVCVKLNEGEGA
ncbi:MAG TPA: aldehyde dehydrogenase [Verrucomicrobiae bacterium]|nr:aldehyde dehydrogenase [Verrucomicrobiae bacterium]